MQVDQTSYPSNRPDASDHGRCDKSQETRHLLWMPGFYFVVAVSARNMRELNDLLVSAVCGLLNCARNCAKFVLIHAPIHISTQSRPRQGLRR